MIKRNVFAVIASAAIVTGIGVGVATTSADASISPSHIIPMCPAAITKVHPLCGTTPTPTPTPVDLVFTVGSFQGLLIDNGNGTITERVFVPGSTTWVETTFNPSTIGTTTTVVHGSTGPQVVKK